MMAAVNGKFYNETRARGISIKRVYTIFLTLYDEKYESHIVRNQNTYLDTVEIRRKSRNKR